MKLFGAEKIHMSSFIISLIIITHILIKQNRIFKAVFCKSEQGSWFLQRVWFEKRQLTWEGLANIFDDLKVKYIAKRTVIYNFMRTQTSVTLIKNCSLFRLCMKTVTFIKPEERLDEITAYQIGKADKYTWGIVRV